MLRDLLATARDRIADLEALAKTALEAFEVVDDPKATLRTSEVAAYVAARQDVENSPRFRGDVLEAMARVGAKTYWRDNIHRYRGVRRRG